MELIDGSAALAEDAPPHEPACVFMRPASADRFVLAVRWVGADASAAERLLRSPPRRPVVQADGGLISLVALAVDEDGAPAAVHVHVGEHGLAVLCPDAVAATVSPAIARVDGVPGNALVAVLLALARLSEEAMQRLSDVALELDLSTTGLTSGSRRRAIARARSLLFVLQQLLTAHRRVLADPHLADALPDTARPELDRAADLFDATSITAGQLSALLNDTLSRQATIVSERLTLVAVIFFPLTVSTGFFGMNFGWLTARIGSAPAFILLGLVLPCLFVAATLLGARWLTRE